MKIQLLLLVAFLGLVVSGCKDPVEGCTDPDANNYNPDAEVENYTCSYDRDKFIAVYSGSVECGAPFNLGSDFTMVINEGLAASNSVEVNFENSEIPLPVLQATIDGNTIVLTEKEVNDVPFGVLLVDVLVSGGGEMNESETTINGSLSIGLLDDNGDVVTTSECPLEATKN